MVSMEFPLWDGLPAASCDGWVYSGRRSFGTAGSTAPMRRSGRCPACYAWQRERPGAAREQKRRARPGGSSEMPAATQGRERLPERLAQVIGDEFRLLA